MMDETHNIIFNKCESVKEFDITVRVLDEGTVFNIPVYLEEVCQGRKIIIGVSLYKDGILYAMNTREIFTGGTMHGEMIKNFYAGNFEFLLIGNCKSNIEVRALAHYIY